MNRLSSASIRAKLPAAAVAYRGAWVVWVYCALRYLALERHDHTYSDSTDYHAAASLPLFSVEFWAGLRPSTIPLFWKLLGNNESLTTTVQFLVSVVCWLVLAWAVAGLSNVRVVRWLAYVLVLGLSLTGPVAQWDRTLLSESPSFSLMALLIALAIRLIKRPRYGLLAATLFVAFVWVFARDTNVFIAVAVIPVLLVCLLRSSKAGAAAARGRHCRNDCDRHPVGRVGFSWKPIGGTRRAGR